MTSFLQTSQDSKYKDYISKSSTDDNYYIKIALSPSESIIIRCYETKKLKNCCYEAVIVLNEVKELTSSNSSISSFYNLLSQCLENDKFEIIPNKNFLTFQIDEKIKIKLKISNISDVVEYNYILCKCINSLSENIIELQEYFIKNISDANRNYIRNDNEHMLFDEKLKLIKEENILLGQKYLELEKENDNNKKEINSLKKQINKLNAKNSKANSKNYPMKHDLVTGFNNINNINNIYNQNMNDNNNPYYNNIFGYFGNIPYFYYTDYDSITNRDDLNYSNNMQYLMGKNAPMFNLYNPNLLDKNLRFNKLHKNTNNSIKSFSTPLNINNTYSREAIFGNKINKKENENIGIENEIYEDIRIFNSKYGIACKDNKIKKLDIGSKRTGNSILSELPKYGFNNLNKLYLSDNQINDINDLVLIKSNYLEKIYFSNNKIADISILEKVHLENLQTLYLNNNDISDINILSKANFPNLKNLSLHDNKISDIKVFEFVKFKELQFLSLHDNQIKDITVFKKANFIDLDTLYIFNNHIVDISSFDRSKFPRLTYFYIYGNNIDYIKYGMVIRDLQSNIDDFKG